MFLNFVQRFASANPLLPKKYSLEGSKIWVYRQLKIEGKIRYHLKQYNIEILVISIILMTLACLMVT